MIVKPMVRSNICLNAHPAGCKKAVEDQISYIKNKSKERAEAGKSVPFGSSSAPKNVLVLGCSNGYGLASRITAAFGYGAATIGVSFEKAGSATKWGTPGWYNNLAFDAAAEKDNLKSFTIDGDAFSHEVKQQVVDAAKELSMKFDLVVYSLASPVRVDPDTGVMYKSVLKPTGKVFSGMTIDPFTGALKEISAEPANEEEIENTRKVMGGEDWALWIEKLSKEDVLAKGCMTVAYSYIGPEVSHAIYRSGTIGKAKEHLEKTARVLDSKMAEIGGHAYVSVNKGLVTRASAVIPIIPLYLSVLFKVMKAKGTHEGCIEQINRLFAERLYISADRAETPVPVDEENRIRIDDFEMDLAIQAEVSRIMPSVTSENSAELTDLEGYRHDFLATSGFDIEGVDYEADVAAFDRI
ncbi:MAG: trans-2-enoyl-CoA reductase family protein [Treponemataceae bacterium]|nr:trans-2-enoyl-CoA reductase family protein [Treponemataceae bacterium]